MAGPLKFLTMMPGLIAKGFVKVIKSPMYIPKSFVRDIGKIPGAFAGAMKAAFSKFFPF